MTLFSWAGLLLAIFCFILAVVIYKFAKNQTHKIWAYFNIVVAVWGAGTFFSSMSGDSVEAVRNWRLTYVPCTFIAVVFYHLVCKFCNLSRSKILTVVYLQAFIFLPLIVFTNLFVRDTVFIFDSIYYHKATGLFTLWLTIWVAITIAAFYELGVFIKNVGGVKRNHAMYLFWGMFLGFAGGTTTVIPSYGFKIYPAWHFSICVYAPIMTYAMFRYRFMDISLAVTRTSIFVTVYSLILGLPFLFAFGWQNYLKAIFGESWWLAPLITSTIFSTAGPFIYFYIQRKAEEQLLKEQRSYQDTLRQASMGMGRIKDLDKLLNLIVHVVTRTVKLEHSAIYLFHAESKRYVLRAANGREITTNLAGIVYKESALVKYLEKNRDPLVYEEVKQRAQDYNDEYYAQLEVVLRELDAALVIPSMIDDRLIAITALGKKNSGKLYTQDDISVFSILGNQAALAIENAQFYEDMKKTHEQLFKAEKMATIGTMADGLSHQINNRLHALGFIASDALDTVQLKKKSGTSLSDEEFMTSLEHALKRIQANVKQGGEVVEGLLKYTRKGDQGFSAVDLNKLLDASLEMLQFKIKIKDIKIERQFSDLPAIKGNFTQLQEVFFNLIDNAYDAMMQRKEDLKEPGFVGHLQVQAQKNNNNLEIVLQDNGIGVKKEDVVKLFTPFFTTKLSSRKGTGLGLYVIRQIIEENHKGKVEFSSEFAQGSRIKIILPAAA